MNTVFYQDSCMMFRAFCLVFFTNLKGVLMKMDGKIRIWVFYIESGHTQSTMCILQ